MVHQNVEHRVNVIGAGLGRTGTTSLKLALERLLNGRCYHMAEMFARPNDIPIWLAASEGVNITIDWPEFFRDFVATVDWPGAAFWPELHYAFPESVVLLSTRSSTDEWYESARATIFDGTPELNRTIYTNMFARDWDDPAGAKRAYERHNAVVRAVVEPSRLVDWQPGDGWEPICEALALPVPDEPFPHVNNTADFRAVAGLDG